ncbi:MAG: ABC transporter permease [Bacteroidales bacterium]|jgi:ABC-2 type transport system permease protein|nr:ABC transporter permease [Bacteroidales bacterium]
MANNTTNTFKAILIKEIRHVLLDKITMLFTLLIPVILVLIFGYAIRTEIYDAPIAVLDYSQTSQSKSLINSFLHSDFFKVEQFLDSKEDIATAFREGKIKMILVIPQDYDYALTINKNAQIQLITDASDPNISTTLVGYARQMISLHEKSLQNADIEVEPIEFRIQMRYNPQLKSAYMFIPGNIALIMILVTSLMAAVSLASERENGSWKMLIISPAHQLVIIIAKILPYMIMSLICTAIVITLGVIIFGIPIEGNIALLLLVCFLFMFTSCSLGVLLAVVSNTQQVAMLSCLLGFFLPTLLLSDFIFPIENQPILLQWLSHLMPAKWFITALRDIMLKGVGWAMVWRPVVILTSMNVVLLGASLWQLYSKDKR